MNKDWKEVWPERVTPTGRIKQGLTPEQKLEVWVYRASQIHNSKYSYKNAAYVNAKTSVAITCPIHGDFLQTADAHIVGKGCPRCAGLAFKGLETFIEEAEKCHQGKYDYSKTTYSSALTKTTIICGVHGEFMQSPNKHLAGQGCPQCSTKGASTHVYFLQYEETLYKIGITNNLLGERLYKLQKGYGKNLTVLKCVPIQDPELVEKYLLNKYNKKPSLDRKFEGYTELRILTEQEVAEICSFLETI